MGLKRVSWNNADGRKETQGPSGLLARSAHSRQKRAWTGTRMRALA